MKNLHLLATKWKVHASEKFASAAQCPEEMGSRLLHHSAIIYHTCANELMCELLSTLNDHETTAQNIRTHLQEEQINPPEALLELLK